MRLLRLFRQRPRQHLLHSQHPLLNLHRRLRRHPHPHLSLSLHQHQRLRQRRSLDQPQRLQLQRERRSRQMFRTNFCHQLCVALLPITASM
jgi:hypothetical protein